jgi:hypothetical protein
MRIMSSSFLRNNVRLGQARKKNGKYARAKSITESIRLHRQWASNHHNCEHSPLLHQEAKCNDEAGIICHEHKSPQMMYPWNLELEQASPYLEELPKAQAKQKVIPEGWCDACLVRAFVATGATGRPATAELFVGRKATATICLLDKKPVQFKLVISE